MSLVTGSGRSATGWCAEVLRACGVRAGHQDVIRHEHVLGRTPIDWRDYEVEVSYEAAPLASVMDDRRVVLVIRHPLAVARSWVALGAFDDDSGFGDLRESLARHAPQVLRYSEPVERALVFWYEWNLMVWPHADAVLTVEDLAPRALLDSLGLGDRYDEAAEFVPRDTNARPHQERPTPMPTWSDAPSDYAARIATFAGHLGYSLRETVA